MEFIYNKLIYSQRTPKSKFICMDLDGNIVKSYEPDELPYEVYCEYLNIKMQLENPKKFFTFKDGFDFHNKEIVKIAKNVHNLFIPQFIDNNQVYDIEYRLTSLVDVEYISFPSGFRRYPSALLSTSPNLIKIEIGDNCEVCEGAFANKENLLEVKLPDTLKTIKNACFYNCHNLRKVNLENILEFDNNAFSHCKNLDAKISKDTKKIGEKAFFKSGITSLDLKNTIIKNAAFAMCDNLVSVNVKSKNIAENAFADCKKLK